MNLAKPFNERLRPAVLELGEDILITVIGQDENVENYVPDYWDDLREFLQTEYERTYRVYVRNPSTN